MMELDPSILSEAKLMAFHARAAGFKSVNMDVDMAIELMRIWQERQAIGNALVDAGCEVAESFDDPCAAIESIHRPGSSAPSMPTPAPTPPIAPLEPGVIITPGPGTLPHRARPTPLTHYFRDHGSEQPACGVEWIATHVPGRVTCDRCRDIALGGEISE